MAKQRTKLKDFFEGKRRRCRLQNFQVLKDRKDILRAKLLVSMYLSNQPADGMNDKFAEPYLLMAGEKSTLNLARVAVGVDNATFHVFATDVSTRPSVKANAADLQNFRLIGEGVDEKRTVTLVFDAQLPVTDAEDDPLVNWLMKHLHGDFFVESVPSQMTIEEDKVNGSDPADPKPNRKKKPEQANLLVN
jgi:hypothetical protein